MQRLISSNQTAYVEGDLSWTATSMFGPPPPSTVKKIPKLLLKLDFSKAFDSLASVGALLRVQQKKDNWLQVAVVPGIEELTLMLPSSGQKIKYNFPCSLLSDGVRKSIRYLKLTFCIFRPTAALGHLASLTSLQLHYVRITGDELECLLTNSLALEQFVLSCCKKIICLRVPCVLQRFSYLRVEACLRLKLIECKAPNLSTLDFCGKAILSLGGPFQIKNLSMQRSNVVCYARAELPPSMPNLDTLTLCSYDEVVNTPMLPTKFPYLKHLVICLGPGTFSSSCDYFSLVSFLDASPSLETLILEIIEEPMEHESILGHSSHLRQMAEES
ncbi:hypothetical protein U9M48_006436 [Paspalum notatum var. saurae]|uniref:At1g61320/AtMIF1 LRR domain-containing protein n=1 Tax=Paspalum notatum var. saurae TaxID=547442 RepID=A0AAQ3PPF9_PASNO